ncbi:hypothetical protein D9M70_590890 [compost metagenome]
MQGLEVEVIGCIGALGLALDAVQVGQAQAPQLLGKIAVGRLGIAVQGGVADGAGDGREPQPDTVRAPDFRHRLDHRQGKANAVFH